jgi:hypothetical protein
MVQRGDWLDKLAGLRNDDAELRLDVPLGQGTRGGSGAFPGLADDGKRYWIKPLNNQQGLRIPITEQIVGRAGALTGAPTCIVRTIQIPSQLVGWEFRPGYRLEASIAHACEHVGDAADVRGLDRRNEDDNARRHAHMMALFDWCWGGDPQGLVALSAESRYYSHDHGWYLPPIGPTWDEASLEWNIDIAHEYVAPNDGITPAFVDDIVGKLIAVQRSDICTMLARIPAIWPATNAELECVGFFLESRAPAVAARLAVRFGGAI